MTPAAGIAVRGLRAWYGALEVVKGVSLDIPPRAITAVIGPSGCGKSTFIRCLNRLHELVPGARVSGQVLLDGEDVYRPGLDPVEVRRQIGMVFQRPNPFPTMTIFENVAAGLRFDGSYRRAAAVVEESLHLAALWDEVRDRLRESPMGLSGGQQQRLCIARALAVKPAVLLMDEPCSALDPVATLKIEELLVHLKEDLTIVIVTHNMQQAARVADYTAFFLHGELVEYGPTREIFTNPRDQRTEDYITGRFG